MADPRRCASALEAMPTTTTSTTRASSIFPKIHPTRAGLDVQRPVPYHAVMARINEHYLKLKAGYLFPEIARRVEQYKTRNPDRAGRVISCGIGDVTEPIPAAARQAMHDA